MDTLVISIVLFPGLNLPILALQDFISTSTLDRKWLWIDFPDNFVWFHEIMSGVEKPIEPV